MKIADLAAVTVVVVALLGCAGVEPEMGPDASVTVEVPSDFSAPTQAEQTTTVPAMNPCWVRIDPGFSPGVAVEGISFSTLIFRVDSSETQSEPCVQTTDLVVCYHTEGVGVNKSQQDGGDFSLSGQVVIAAGSSKVEIHLQPFADGIDEGPETVQVVLDPCPGYRVRSPPPSSTTTIYDHDPGS